MAATMMKSTISMLRVKNARESEKFYCEKLGFKTSWELDPGDGFPVFLEIVRDQVAFHLSEHDGDGPLGVQTYVNVENAQKLYDEFVSHGVELHGPPEEAEWGELTFSLEDLDGNILRIGSPISQKQ